ncbi:MAG: LptA/OstA family protein [bacterium]
MLETILTLAVAASINVDPHLIHIESDEAIHSIEGKRYEWTGNVIITEEAYTLNARKVIVLLNDLDEPCKITAVGEPLKAFGPYKDEDATVSGEVVLYDCDQAKVRVARNAHVNIPADSMSLSADNIIYDLITKRIHATGTRPAERVQLRIDPAKP